MYIHQCVGCIYICIHIMPCLWCISISVLAAYTYAYTLCHACGVYPSVCRLHIHMRTHYAMPVVYIHQCVGCIYICVHIMPCLWCISISVLAAYTYAYTLCHACGVYTPPSVCWLHIHMHTHYAMPVVYIHQCVGCIYICVHIMPCLWCISISVLAAYTYAYTLCHACDVYPSVCWLHIHMRTHYAMPVVYIHQCVGCIYICVHIMPCLWCISISVGCIYICIHIMPCLWCTGVFQCDRCGVRLVFECDRCGVR